MTRINIQSQVEADLLNGIHHSVGTIYTQYHTHDGRKIISRIRKKWAKCVPAKIMGDYFETPEIGSPYKIFFLEKYAITFEEWKRSEIDAFEEPELTMKDKI